MLALVAAGMYFAATQYATEVEQTDLMSEFEASPATPPASGSQGTGTEVASVEVMLVGLKQRLDEQPGDVDGWVLLSKSYYHLNRMDEAKEAFEKARALGYTGRWQPLPRIDSFSQNSSSSINFKDYKTSTDDSQGEAAEPAGLKLKVSLNPDLQKQISPGAAVFVFVREAQNPGPPLAVVRKTVGELPFEIALNDSHAMIPSKNLSSAKNVIAGARISVSGNPTRQPGDYETLSDSIPADFKETLELVINDKI